MLQIYGKLKSPPGEIYKSDTKISWMMGKKKVSQSESVTIEWSFARRRIAMVAEYIPSSIWFQYLSSRAQNTRKLSHWRLLEEPLLLPNSVLSWSMERPLFVENECTLQLKTTNDIDMYFEFSNEKDGIRSFGKSPMHQLFGDQHQVITHMD